MYKINPTIGRNNKTNNQAHVDEALFLLIKITINARKMFITKMEIVIIPVNDN